ncbi:hypothetical protein [Marinobacter sp.]|uniref:hypothetical protein n=1 Tax=Marinobacter sp. TaxID=50741 RepID=UPI000C8CB57D|nr:hypothetical protein [Marinobacter sp.]MAB53549.1 hypothetical protein [Marinobacter sp.]|tara:strand:+ start:132 stop:647 length:516 start_codon:yes stop_codon:yes gene_type:complete
MNWKSIVSTVAPGIAAALGGPLAGVAVRGIAGALLGDEDASEDAVAQAVLAASPEDLRKLKEAELTFAAKMKELEIDLERLHSTDRASARDRQIKTGDKVPGVIAACVLVGFFGILSALVFVDIPERSMQPLLMMLSALATSVGALMQFYFGSSAGSAAKNQMLSDLARRP